MFHSTANANAGVHNGTGMEFQKHSALYLLLENYDDLKSKKYFICIEHYDDFLFCLLTDSDLVSYIECYQAKKSSSKWSLNEELYEIIKKILIVGDNLRQDPILKDSNYSHSLHFISNNEISLGTRRNRLTVNESNIRIRYNDLNPELRETIRSKVEILLEVQLEGIKEIEHFNFGFIDFPRTSSNQKDQLVGSFSRVFGSTVHDHKAAVDTLIQLFRDSELKFNQGGYSSLLDNRKRVTSSEINEVISVITTQQRAYSFWRTEGNSICESLSISILDRKEFELAFQNSFDFFKDKKQVEHLKILKFTNENRESWRSYTNHIDCLQAIFTSYNTEHNSQLNELNVKAVILAAYMEMLQPFI
jgi:hypothetical protein